MRIARLAGCTLLLMLPVWATQAEESAQITTSASATETIRPTIASFDVSIGSIARTMEAARASNATTTAAVKAALLAAGLSVAAGKVWVAAAAAATAAPRPAVHSRCRPPARKTCCCPPRTEGPTRRFA